MDRELGLNQTLDTQVSIQEEHQKTPVLVDIIHTHPGHKVWEVDFATGQVKEAEYELQAKINVDGSVPTGGRGKLIVRKHCFYVGALNKKAAIKKAKKGENGSRIDARDTFLRLAVGPSFKPRKWLR